ncbi:hypothetical protein SUDANB99_02002 [Streptomyces sp. enrichment culture]
MRPGVVALRAATAAAALVLAPAAAPALAGDPGGGPSGDPVRGRVTATATPGTVAPGGEVDVRVEGCAGPGGTVRSPVFVADVELSGRTGGVNGTLRGDTTVRSGTAPGSYPLTVVCGDRTHRDAGRLRVDPAPPPGPHAPDRAGGGGTAVHATGPRAATGAGTAASADVPRAAGTGTGTRSTHTGAGTHAGAGTGAAAAAPRVAGPVANAPSVAGPLAEAPGTAGQGPGTRHAVIGLVLAAVAAVAVAVRTTRRRRGPDAD